jgi:hypothetical protein
MAPADELLVGRVEDFLSGLQAAKRSRHTLGAYRDDLLGRRGGDRLSAARPRRIRAAPGGLRA